MGAQFQSIKFHKLLLNDKPRSDAYRVAISQVVQPGDVVLDIGTGSGLLAFFACQAGAERLKARTRIEIDSALVRDGLSTAVRFDLEDDGEGVPEDLRPLLFMPMVTGKRDGTGLGLALAQQIADAHDGILTYEPLPVGSRFCLRLPLPVQAPAQAEAHG